MVDLSPAHYFKQEAVKNLFNPAWGNSLYTARGSGRWEDKNTISWSSYKEEAESYHSKICIGTRNPGIQIEATAKPLVKNVRRGKEGGREREKTKRQGKKKKKKPMTNINLHPKN